MESAKTAIDQLDTEQRNALSTEIDTVSTLRLCEIINEEDSKISQAVSKHLTVVAKVIDAISERVQRGGRIVQLGAGTSGRLGVLDASEIPPTFSASPDIYIGLIAGGDDALRNPIEGAEDSRQEGLTALTTMRPPLNPNDTVIGIATSGRTPYVLGALQHGKALGCFTVGICCVTNSQLGSEGNCAELIECIVGPEVVTGSTRMKAGTATKMILNMISTGVMIRSGKTYGNLMVDLKTSNAKLVLRARRIIRTIASQESELKGVPSNDLDDATIDIMLSQCKGSVKLAALAIARGLDAARAQEVLSMSDGRLKNALRGPI